MLETETVKSQSIFTQNVGGLCVLTEKGRDLIDE